MNLVFADTLYWIASVKPNDPYHNKVKEIKSNLGDVKLVTSDEVLSEFLTALSRGGEKIREIAFKMVYEILNNKNVEVVPQSRDSFISGLELYKKRLDKSYSLIDCISMQIMHRNSISNILTNDSHFSQEGFIILI